MQSNSPPQDFVQIVNLSRQHWVCVSNVLSSPGVVDVYDSIPAYSRGSNTLQQQIAAILKTPDSSFTINYVDVQRQNGGSDCGLFAVMFAAALCNGKDPHTISVDQQGMRRHLHKCFEEGEISEFPAASEPRRIGRHRVAYTTNIPVVCFCRLFWHKADTGEGTTDPVHTLQGVVSPEVCKARQPCVTFDYYCVLIGAWYLTSCVYAFLCAHIDWE